MRKFISSVGLLVIAVCLQACSQPLAAVGPLSGKSTRVPNRNDTTFAAGYSHSCVILADGRVQCWGGNQNGQLGDGRETDFSWDPVTVTGITNAAAIAAGGDHTCALLADGRVRCWGQNHFGELGNGTLTKSAVPVTVKGLTNATAVTAGWLHGCAVLADGQVKCWGLMKNDGKTGTIDVVVSVSGITNAVAVAGGERHTCALLGDGRVQCWGENRFGQLGNGTKTDSWVPVPVSGITNAVAVASGYGHSCALLANGHVRCWGVKVTGEGTGVVSLLPETVSGITSAVAVASGHYHSCALLADGGVRCWGNNSGGELGNGLTTVSLVPVPVSGIANAATVATGGCQYSCAVLADGRVQCWGHVHFRIPDKATVMESSLPVFVRGLADAVRS